MNKKIIDETLAEKVGAARRLNSAKKTARISRREKKVLKSSSMSERHIARLDGEIPKLAKVATRRAYRQTLASGHSVTIAVNGELVKVFPNGTRRSLKKIEPPVKVRKGQVIEIK